MLENPGLDKKLNRRLCLDSLSEDKLYEIHLASLEVLAKTGVFVEDQKAREALYSSGATVDDKNFVVKIPSSMVEDAIRSAPKDVTLSGRTPDFDIPLEPNQNFYVNIATMVMAGGTGPVHLAGALVQTNAEVLAGIVLTQIWRKGTPVIYSGFSTGMDLKYGTSPLGSPETATLAVAVAELSCYYQLPCMVPGIATDSKQSGAQAAFEKALTGIPAALAGANLIYGIGGLETGLTFDYGQAVLDDEIVRMIKSVKQGIEVNDETLSVDLIHEIGPFGEYLSHDTTLLNMKSLSTMHLFDRSNRE